MYYDYDIKKDDVVVIIGDDIYSGKSIEKTIQIVKFFVGNISRIVLPPAEQMTTQRTDF